MRKELAACLLAFASTAAFGCAHQELTDHERIQVSERFHGANLELAQSMWIAPFFRDDARRLLLRVPPDENIVMVTPEGKPMLPGAVMGVLPAGTHVTVLKVDFPGGWQTLQILEPRDRPWVELATDKPEPAYVLLLPPDLKDEDDALKKISPLLTAQPLDHDIAALSDADRAAINTKILTPGITARAVELAWGPPLQRDEKIAIKDGVKSENDEWTWRSDTQYRVVHITDGVLVSQEQRPVKQDQ